LAKLRLSAPEFRARGLEIDFTLQTYIFVAKQFEANQIEGASPDFGLRNIKRPKAGLGLGEGLIGKNAPAESRRHTENERTRNVSLWIACSGLGLWCRHQRSVGNTAFARLTGCPGRSIFDWNHPRCWIGKGKNAKGPEENPVNEK
jgi:hypothetical protein